MKAKTLTWTEHFKQQKSSGLTIQAYCERYHLSPGMFYYWKRKLSKAQIEEPITFQELQIDCERPARLVFEIQLSDHAVIRIEGSVSASFLRELAGC